LKGGEGMSKLIALIVGAWIMYCSMIGSYDGAMTILAFYLLLVVLDPLNKKGTTAANSRTDK